MIPKASADSTEIGRPARRQPLLFVLRGDNMGEISDWMDVVASTTARLQETRAVIKGILLFDYYVY